MHFLLRLLEPAAFGEALFPGRGLLRLGPRLVPREGGNHDRNGKHREEREQGNERDRRQPRPRSLRLSRWLAFACPTVGSFSSEGLEIIVRPRPAGARDRAGDLFLAFHAAQGAPAAGALQCGPSCQPLVETRNSATVLAPHVTAMVSTAALLGIVALRSHQSSGAA